MDATWEEVETLARILGVSGPWLANRPDSAAANGASAAPVREAAATSPQPSANQPAAPRGLAVAAATPESAQPASATAVTEDPFPLPDPALLEPRDRPAYVFRQSLAEVLARTTAMLHQPGLPARVWRAWRDFDRQVRELLRQLPTD
ncbi:MAG TPA: hypothetical protein VGD81_05775 [Opitutaceae bacterium]